MALISCPECSREISDKAAACPHCGCPVEKETVAVIEPPETVKCRDCYTEYSFDNLFCPNCDLMNYAREKFLDEKNAREKAIKPGSPVICPKCKSENMINAGSKGFGLGKAAIGGLLLGPVGLLGGLIGSKDTVITCLKCGFKWRP
jgi:tellurium resistance protein TerD